MKGVSLLKWIAEWRSLSKQIDRMRKAVEFIVVCAKSAVSVSTIMESILPALKATAEELDSFLARHQSLLSPQALKVRQNYQREYKAKFIAPQPSGSAIEIMQDKLSILMLYQARLDHMIGDFEFFARRTIERAFIHLQRTLIVDEVVRMRWLKAFKNKGEVVVEKLGAINLLAHGIWAFKVDAAGERTDLILGEPLKNIYDDVTRTAEVVALTEWKLVNRNNEQEGAAAAALRQAKLYSSGSLSGLELEKWRYLVLVSIDRLPVHSDIEDNGITYRHINIAIKPTSPSRQKV